MFAISMKWQIVLQGLEITYAKCWTWVDCQIILCLLALFLQCIDVQARPMFSLWFNLVHECHFSLPFGSSIKRFWNTYHSGKDNTI
jgi:hypothetical protein